MTTVSIQRDQLSQYLDQYLQSQRIRDYCPNGLQVQGREQISHIITGVTANQALIGAAIERGADTILVHHGYFWKGEDERVRGIKHARLKALLGHDINLIAYHLPLDMHEAVGNNAEMARLLGLTVEGPIDAADLSKPGNIGRLPKPMTGAELAQHIGRVFNREPLHIGAADGVIETLAWCSGGAQGYLQTAIDAGVDAYITGEINEPAVHLARETNTHFYSAGHHATERYGVKALGEHIADKFGVKVEFIDIDNPV